MRYLDIYNLSRNQPLLFSVAGACLKLANDIINEDPGTKNHDARLLWANRPVLQNAQEMMRAVALDTTIQAKWDTGEQGKAVEQERFDDADLDQILASNIDKMATG